MLFANLWRRNLAFFRLAIITNLEYRVNFLTDAIFQPLLGTLIEITLWVAIFKSAATTEIGGFTREYYLSYVLWGAFIGRITANWMYEFRMIEEVESGSVNSILVRPISFYEYYLSQFMGYKMVTTAISLLVPIIATMYFHLPIHWNRIPIVFVLIGYYLIFAHTIAFWISTLCFRLNKVYSFTVAKNLGLWLLSGELFPLDLLGAGKNIFLALPFSSAVYVPTAYLTGRTDISLIWQGFFSITVGCVIVGFFSWRAWQNGLKKYSGTGA